MKITYLLLYYQAKSQKNKILFLVPTASYIAYANDHNAINGQNYEMLMGRLTVLQQEDIFLDRHREYGLSTYDILLMVVEYVIHLD